MNSWLESAESLYPQTLTWRRELHQIPEVAFQEVETTEYLAGVLDALEVNYRRLDGTGLVAEVAGDHPGPVVALRTDIDGLPVTEDTGLPFASRHPGNMHACGHDTHMAMVLTALTMLKRAGIPRGTLRVIFQPAEEVGLGAESILPQGVLDDVDAIFGVHIFTGMPSGCINIEKGPRMSGSSWFTVEFHGISGHGSTPHKGIDVIPAASAFVQAVQTIPSREVDSKKACVVSIGTFHSGTKANVIADHAVLTGTCRTFDLELREALPDMMQRILDGICAAYRVEGVLDYKQNCPILINDPELSKFALACAKDAEVPLFDVDPLMLSEDFAHYGHYVPAVFAFLGAGEGEFNHHPRFDVDESAMIHGAAYLAAAVSARLNKDGI